MIYAKPFLDSSKKTTAEFLNWLEDGRRELNINITGVGVVTKRNGGSASEVYIHKDLKPVLIEFINQ